MSVLTQQSAASAAVAAMSQEEAATFLYREALLLDRLDFDPWLALYTPDCLFWMPAWRDDGSQTEDPDAELSLIFYRGRRNLEDRVQRIRSGFSVASAVMPRVAHLISNVLVTPIGAGDAGGNGSATGEGARVRLDSAFVTHVHDVRTNRSHAYFGRYEHELVRDADGNWKIAGKIIRLINDTVPTMLDVYGV